MSERSARTPSTSSAAGSCARCSAGAPTTSASCSSSWRRCRSTASTSTPTAASCTSRASRRLPERLRHLGAIQVRDRVLGEKLGIVDPQDFSDLESLRAEVVSLIDDHLAGPARWRA